MKLFNVKVRRIFEFLFKYKHTIFEGLLLPNRNHNDDAILQLRKSQPAAVDIYTQKQQFVYISNNHVSQLLPSVGNQNNCLPIPLNRQRSRET